MRAKNGAPRTPLSQLEVKILCVFIRSRETIRSRALATELERDRREVARALVWLAEQGLIDRVGWGAYRLHREVSINRS